MSSKKGLNLAIDIGNTRVKIGVFQKDKLILKEIFAPISPQILSSFLKKHTFFPSKVILSSTAKRNNDLEDYLSDHFFYLNLSPQTALPINIDYSTPETLGKDRIAAVVGAQDLFPDENVLVIDAGTCITYELLNASGTYLGGNIAPGIEMRLKAMHHFTARLPKIERQRLDKDWGYSTETAIRTGAQQGALLEVEGFIRFYQGLFANLNVVLTGGDSDFFEKNLKTKIFVNQNLVLLGLNKILNYNAQLEN